MNLSDAERITVDALERAIGEVRTGCEAIRERCGVTGDSGIAEDLEYLAQELAAHLTTMRTYLNEVRNQARGRGRRVPAGISDLRRAFRSHLDAAKEPVPPHYLLLFYAAECGLKKLYLDENSMSSLEQVREFPLYRERGHDLTAWLRALHISAAGCEPAASFRLLRGTDHWPTETAHQAWRYGARMEVSDERALVESLKRLCTRIGREDDR
jgi:hypothetical protein